MVMNRPPVAIFYDLETSDQNTVGQILNYAFIAVDADWQVIGTCAGDVRITRLQLPRAGAILANRVNVRTHQRQTEKTEVQAMLEIKDFIEEVIRESGNPVALVGYNSDKFDLRYLRTSMIRNGINPYFDRQILPKDLLIVSRKLLVDHVDFPRLASADDPEKLSLRLETLTQHFGLLEGAQTHTSLDDVTITIDLARLYLEKFEIDVRTYEGYELLPDPAPGTIVVRKVPEYALAEPARHVEVPYLLLAADYRSALWVDLKAYEEVPGKGSIRSRRKACGELFFEYTAVEAPLKQLAEKALVEFKGITPKNFFERTLCDVEQDIYQLDFVDQGALAEAIHAQKEERVKKARKKEGKTLLARYKLANYVPAGVDASADERFWDLFTRFVAYRYGGKMRISRYQTEEVEFYPTLTELFEEIQLARATATVEDSELLDALEEFYRASDVFRVVSKD